MSLITAARLYFDSYSQKDLGALEGLLATNVSLKDWELELTGREAVLLQAKTVFQDTDQLRVDVCQMFQGDSSIAAELDIFVDDVYLRVVDVLAFNKDSKICCIRAYKG